MSVKRCGWIKENRSSLSQDKFSMGKIAYSDKVFVGVFYGLVVVLNYEGNNFYRFHKYRLKFTSRRRRRGRRRINPREYVVFAQCAKFSRRRPCCLVPECQCKYIHIYTSIIIRRIEGQR